MGCIYGTPKSDVFLVNKNEDDIYILLRGKETIGNKIHAIVEEVQEYPMTIYNLRGDLVAWVEVVLQLDESDSYVITSYQGAHLELEYVACVKKSERLAFNEKSREYALQLKEAFLTVLTNDNRFKFV